jgi:DnaJ-class molecular chaperone
MVLSPVGHRDYYRILKVPPESNAETITGAFRRLARRYHPDRSTESDAEERFKEITEAYSVLSDPVRRAGYDAARMAELYPSRPARRSHFFSVGAGMDADGLNRVCLGATGGTPSRTASDIRLEVEIPLRAAASATEQVVRSG